MTEPLDLSDNSVTAATRPRRRTAVVSVGGDIAFPEPDDPTGAETAVATMEPAPPPPPDPLAGYTFRTDSPGPPDADNEMLREIASVRKEAALDELASVVRRIDEDLDALRHRLGADGDLYRYFAVVRPMLDRREGYRARHAALAKVLGSDATLPLAPELDGNFIVPRSPRGATSLLSERQMLLAVAERELAAVGEELESLGPDWPGTLDHMVDWWQPRLRKRAELTERCDKLRAELGRITSETRRLCVEAIEAAGGPSVVERGLCDGALLTEADAELAAAVAGLKSVAEQLDRLEDPDGSLLAANLTTDRDRQAARVASLKTGLRGRRAAAARTTVEKACQGDEPARAALEAACRAVPQAFDPALADRLAACRFEQHQVDLIRSTLTSEE